MVDYEIDGLLDNFFETIMDLGWEAMRDFDSRDSRQKVGCLSSSYLSRLRL